MEIYILVLPTGCVPFAVITGTTILVPFQDHSGNELGKWEQALHRNASSHWLSPKNIALSEVTAAPWKIRPLEISSTGFPSSNELQWLANMIGYQESSQVTCSIQTLVFLLPIYMNTNLAHQISEAWITAFTVTSPNLNGFVQDCSNSIPNALELLQSCTKPLMLPL